jgi:hypothetical protein
MSAINNWILVPLQVVIGMKNSWLEFHSILEVLIGMAAVFFKN